jgi:hypothetical protein
MDFSQRHVVCKKLISATNDATPGRAAAQNAPAFEKLQGYVKIRTYRKV